MKAVLFDLDGTLTDLVSELSEKGYNVRHEQYFYCRYS